ncbi:hypothetical protein ACIBCN_35245 [Nocardia sp. NPDC051052]|uniref:hypothetical protein n=1 Tax=Nocardia sp. NPDC051052 TaxID=3364322 RepID=UPI003787D482
MTETSPDPDTEDLRAVFDTWLARTIAGQAMSNHTGLDGETTEALEAIAGAIPPIPLSLIEAAHAAFAGQLDGSNGIDVPSFLPRQEES